MASRWLPVLLSLALIPLVGACVAKRAEPGPRAQSPDARAADQRSLAQIKSRDERQRLEERCLRERPELETRMAALRRAESRLARVKEESYVPSPPPKPWDESAESRFRLEDREVDWQRQLQDEEAWQRREESRRSRWLAEHDERLREAQEGLDRQARELRSLRADLFTGPASIEFNPEVAEDIRTCQRVGTRPVGETAPRPADPKASKSVIVSSHSDTNP
jgi:hypothetical protein